jgi:hypothetical protein
MLGEGRRAGGRILGASLSTTINPLSTTINPLKVRDLPRTVFAFRYGIQSGHALNPLQLVTRSSLAERLHRTNLLIS